MQTKTLKKILILLLAWWIILPLLTIVVPSAYIICWAFYLLCAQTDAPPSQLKVPLSPKRVFKVSSYLLHCLYENLTGPFIPSILQYGWHKLSSQRKKISVKKNIRYSPKNRLDIYFPDRVHSPRSSQVFPDNMSYYELYSNNINVTGSSHVESPVIIFISSSWNSGNKTTCMPVANNLQNQGYIVVVPDITLYPKGKITEMVADVQQCIQWTYNHIRQFRGNPSQIYLMGHSAGALLSALTVIHDACATLHALPINTTDVKIPVCGHTNGMAGLPRIQGLILFSGVYDTTYHYAYLHQRGLEQVHAMPRVMGNTSESLLQCSPSYLLNYAFNNSQNRDQLRALLPRKVFLIHGNLKHISPCIDLIVPTKRLCEFLLEDIRECCQTVRPNMMGENLNEGQIEENDNYNRNRNRGRTRRRMALTRANQI
ncbi:Alpha/Beta hydrolase protein [Gigaspora rosea]|uniref:Alpha/Beta hydrolase protein n=1 Tax=Gigaspora rosea TaxID=44941 RepID=A0A397U9M2_9GLOM|nr:Alpha/Beta hydrolase protein [Gigaspora rosea]